MWTEPVPQHLDSRNRREFIEQCLQTLMDKSTAVIYVTSPDQRLLMANRRFIDLFGLDAGSIIGRRLDEVFPREISERFAANNQIVLQRGEAIEFQEQAPHSDGLHTYVSIKAPVLESDGRAVAICGISTDITPLQRVQTELVELNQKLEQRVAERTADLVAMARRVAEAAQLERERLATELHDYLAQTLIGCQMQLMTSQTSPGEARIDEVRAELQRAVEYTRTLIADLNPAKLQTSGLVGALDALAQRLQRSHGLSVSFRGDALTPNDLDSSAANVAFRVVREALLNVARHAGVQEAVVAVTRGDPKVQITVRDEGKGMNPDAVLTRRDGHLGLYHAIQNVQAIGGKLEIDSSPGRGTSIKIELDRRDVTK